MRCDLIAYKKDLAKKKSFLFYNTVRSFPILHLAIISKNGTVWDVSLNEKVSPSKMFLFNLPKSCSCGYHGYSDDKGILNFIEGHLNRKFVQYHPSFNGKGHKNGIKHHLKGVEVGWQFAPLRNELLYQFFRALR